jgi:hypothetical protein
MAVLGAAERGNGDAMTVNDWWMLIGIACYVVGTACVIVGVVR